MSISRIPSPDGKRSSFRKVGDRMLKRKAAAMALAGALAVSAAVPAFAAVNMEIYTYGNGIYTKASVLENFVENVESLGDECYSVDFAKRTVYGRSAYIESVEINGETFYADSNGDMNLMFEYQPVELLEDLYGNPFSYSVFLGSGGSVTSSEGAIVIN